MSLQSIESFIAFPATTGDDTFTTANTALINSTSANLRLAGYDILTASNASAATSGGWVTRADPVSPERVALTHSSAATTGVSTGFTAGIRKNIGTPASTVLGGFSLFVPAGYVRSTSPNATSIFRVTATDPSVSAWASDAAPSYTPGTAIEVFRVGTDMKVRYGGDAPLSSKELAIGRINYLEYSISANEVKVWLDDVLVLQKVISVTRRAIAICAYNYAGTGLANAAGRWAVGNWYNLLDDGVAPNTRLGAATRVIGTRPSSDIVAQFARPQSAPSNAAVAGQNLVVDPPNLLQSASVGATDIYAGIDTATRDAAVVHAVAVKVMAANFDIAAHSVQPVIRTATGTEAASSGGSSFVLPADAVFRPVLNVATVNPDTGLPFTPSEAAFTQFGMRVTS